MIKLKWSEYLSLKITSILACFCRNTVLRNLAHKWKQFNILKRYIQREKVSFGELQLKLIWHHCTFMEREITEEQQTAMKHICLIHNKPRVCVIKAHAEDLKLLSEKLCIYSCFDIWVIRKHADMITVHSHVWSTLSSQLTWSNISLLIIIYYVLGNVAKTRRPLKYELSHTCNSHQFTWDEQSWQ